MQISDLQGKKIVVWGTGMEGLAAVRFLRARLRLPSFIFVDENPEAQLTDDCVRDQLVTDPHDIQVALSQAEIIIKSPGVSLYHPWLDQAKSNGAVITSLVNLWIEDADLSRVIVISGTKGKSTTASLLTHVLEQMGKHVSLIGNFGVPVTDCVPSEFDNIILEMSSYQTANFDGRCHIALITSLYPEHLDWHKSLDQYYSDKTRILECSNYRMATSQALDVMKRLSVGIDGIECYDDPSSCCFKDNHLCVDGENIGLLDNEFLCREHNRSNVCGVVGIIRRLGLDISEALSVMKYYKGLPHRQQSIGEKDGVLYVDDSISTTPQSALAALNVFTGRPITLIAGGQDRGIDLTPLTDELLRNDYISVILIGESGLRLASVLGAEGHLKFFNVKSMKDAVAKAREITPPSGVVLLSPASPSYDMFKNYMERGRVFAREAGFAQAD